MPITILDIKVDCLNKDQVLKLIKHWLDQPRRDCKTVATVNPEMVMAAQNNPDLKQAINNADLSIPDGFGMLLAALRKRNRLPERITGVDLVLDLVLFKNIRWYLLGGKPGVAQKAAIALKKEYPGIQIVGTNDGGVITSENVTKQDKLVTQINSTNPDLLLVAFGVPKQELFLDHYKHKLTAKIGIGVGGTLDFISRTQIRAPKLIRAVGLEWLWRLFMQPKRFKRIWTAVIIFPLAVLFNKKI